MPFSAEPEPSPTPKPAVAESATSDSATATSGGAPKIPTGVQNLPELKLFEAALDAMLIADNDGYYQDANPAACELLDLPRQAVVGRRIGDFLPPDVDFDALWQQFLAQGQARGEQQLVLLNGVVKEVEFSATAHVYPNHHLAILRDITDRKRVEAERDALSRQLEQWVISSAEKLEQTEAELRSQQQRSESILNSLDCVVWSVHPETLETIYANAAAEVLYGHSPEAFLADSNLWFSCIHPDDRPLLMADLKALLQDQKIEREYRIFRSDGEMRWVRGQASLVRDAAGQPMRIDGTTLDITERAMLEAERKQAVQTLQEERDLFMEGPMVLVKWNLSEGMPLEYVSPNVKTQLGYDPEVFTSRQLLPTELIHPDDLARVTEEIEVYKAAQTPYFSQEYRLRHANGEYHWCSDFNYLRYDSDGHVLSMWGYVQDISDRKLVELALRDHQATQQVILEAIPDLLMRVNRDGYILNLISGGEINLYGHIPPDQRQSVYVNFPQDLADQRMHYVRLALATGNRQRYEHALELNGKLHYEESRVVPLNDTETLIIVRDITDRKQAEATQAELNQKLQLVNAELNRLATVDGLTQIANRRSFDQALDREWQRARRQQQSIALILCDIDYFKPYNDNYGHLAGDDCLRQVAQVLSTVVQRPGDMAARYGGEEFVLLLPDTTLSGAIQLVEQVQEAIAAQNLPHAYSKVAPTLTLSFGLACHRPAVKEHSPRKLIHCADLALYKAKAQGRNRYAVSEVDDQSLTS